VGGSASLRHITLTTGAAFCLFEPRLWLLRLGNELSTKWNP